MATATEIDYTSLPSTFLAAWSSKLDPQALIFPPDNPPFALTPIDRAQLALTDAQFTPHSWAELTALIAADRLEELKRWPSSLKAYLAWTAHVKRAYGSVWAYLLEQRLRWETLEVGTEEGEGKGKGALEFALKSAVPFAHPDDYLILRNDWPYALAPGITHIIVWLKQRLPVDADGALTDAGREAVEAFVASEFREGCREEVVGEKVLWFKNSTGLQSVRSLEHVHVLVRGVEEGEVLGRWGG
ncbi:hypothetical protein IQ07DRAFT_611462 [Pyrenochaeta sp. DS3sAY3a]|nr:hypothetical protein IQ07DRAFT_611462 [Pyrenochaeta sp. DS3sAY3a]